MKFYKSETGEVFAYEADGSQDEYIKPGLVLMTEAEVEAHLKPARVLTAETIAARRYEAEVGGITLDGLQINTDDRSKVLINGAALEATIDPEYVMQWKSGDGFVQLTGAQVIGIARAVRAHVQACFDREAELVEALNAGTYSDDMLEQGWPL